MYWCQEKVQYGIHFHLKLSPTLLGDNQTYECVSWKTVAGRTSAEANFPVRNGNSL